MLNVKVDNLPREKDKITIAESYLAVIRLINYYNKMEGTIDEMLSDLSGDVWSDGKPNDSAAWSLWLDCVDDRKPLGG